MIPSGPHFRHVTIIGLGAMGTALAQAFLRQGYHVTIWNRTAARSRVLSSEGADVAETMSEAVRASRLIILCLIDKVVAYELLRALGRDELFAKTVVNLSTGGSLEIARTAAYIEACRASYLDGGIMSYPKDIGKSGTVILYSGNQEAFARHEADLATLAGAQLFLGTKPETAAMAYLSLYAFYFGALASYFEGAALANTAAIDPAQFEILSGIVMGMLVDGAATATKRIMAEDFSGEQASVDVHVLGQEIVRDACHSAGVAHAMTDGFLAYCHRAQDCGHGSSDIASIFGTLKNESLYG